MTPDEILTNVAFGKEHEAGAVKHLSLGTSLLFSSLIHFLVLLSISILINSRGNVLKTDLVPISVLDAPRMEKEARREAKPKLDIKPAPPQKSVVERETLELERSASPLAMAAKEEITKSGGVRFDEEALKAVKQSRFEPAQRDGKNIPAEFTYIYRFRLAKMILEYRDAGRANNDCWMNTTRRKGR